MNTLVIYDSEFGNTEQIAEAISNTLCEFGRVQTVRVQHTHPLNLDGVDLLILGSPTQGWRPTVAMRSLLEYIPTEALSRLEIACFDTRIDMSTWLTGSAAELMTRKLHKRDASHLLPAVSFLVTGMHGPLKTGELERAVNWARSLYKKSDVEQVVMQ